ncbi:MULTISPECIES: hypothetical protein [unclassified Treponema]|uniref:hypothetical protein n=2 Tax=Treponema TaxID=157 RepID=UPI0025DA1582|nr:MULTISPECIES: hypothetical protein [unclassified Treponema]
MGEKMTTHDRTLVFNLCVALFNIILGLAIELVLVGGSFIFLSKFPVIANGISVNVLLPFILFAGIILAMMISVKTISWAIKKFELQDKLEQKAIKRYIHEEL